MNTMSSTTRKVRYLALGGHLGLLLWVTIWQLLLNTEQGYSLFFIFLMYILPLLLPLKGILQGKPYTHAWANFIALYYLLHALTVLYAVEGAQLYATIELLLVIAMFVGCSVFARLRGRELGLKLKKFKTEMKEESQRFGNGKS